VTAQRAVKASLPNYKVEFLVGAADLIEKIVESRYNATAGFDAEEEELEEFDDNDADLGPANEFFTRIFMTAVELGASDVHIEGDAEAVGGIQVRMRIDGVLQIVESADKKFSSAIIAVMKNNFGMDVAERRRPQSGRATKRFGGRQIDFRAETLPAVDSEDLVIRLLDKGNLSLSLDDMGWNERNLERFRKSYKKPYGAIIVTGPTGSGKTSTLYAVLKELTKETEKLITMEDPVEYQLPGLRQVHVNAKEGRDFGTTLRAILRCDPDIVMVGEIRDGETAAIALRAANTGHLVLSTLHTNEAAAGPIQLIQMGVPDYVVADALSVVVAQRLLRRLCPKCKVPYKPSAIELRSLMNGYSEEQIEKVQSSYELFTHNENGCSNCSKGFSGRMAIHEVLTIGDAEKEIILSGSPSALALRTQATKAGGMHTLRHDAFYKALEGLTSLDEIRRVTSD
jgi:type IV pilus assembly protein PilB